MSKAAAALPKIILDSSVLRSAGWRSAAVASLFELARNGQIEVIIPQMAFEERRTQWRDDYAKKIKEGIRHIESARQDPLLDTKIVAALEGAVQHLQSISNAEEVSKRVIASYFAKGAKVEPQDLADGATVIENYLSGAAPFSGVKARKDIPDAYIYEAVKRHANPAKPVYFATGDENLADYVSAIPGAVVLRDVAELMESPAVVGALEKASLSEKWEEHFEQMPDHWFEDTAQEYVEEHYIGFLEGIVLRSRSIPGDSREATMTLFHEVEDFEMSLASHYGNGWIQIECGFECDVSISFMVHRSEAFDLPDWVTVSYGDPDNEHYFDAEGDRRIAVAVVLAVKLEVDSDGDAVIESIALSEPPKVDLLDV